MNNNYSLKDLQKEHDKLVFKRVELEKELEERKWRKPRTIKECNESIVDNDDKIKELLEQIKEINKQIDQLRRWIVMADDLKEQYIKEGKTRGENMGKVEERAFDTLKDFQDEYNKLKKNKQSIQDDYNVIDKQIKQLQDKQRKLKLFIMETEEEMEDTLIGAEKMGFKLKRSEDNNFESRKNDILNDLAGFNERKENILNNIEERGYYVGKLENEDDYQNKLDGAIEDANFWIKAIEEADETIVKWENTRQGYINNYDKAVNKINNELKEAKKLGFKLSTSKLKKFKRSFNLDDIELRAENTSKWDEDDFKKVFKEGEDAIQMYEKQIAKYKKELKNADPGSYKEANAKSGIRIAETEIKRIEKLLDIYAKDAKKKGFKL